MLKSQLSPRRSFSPTASRKNPRLQRIDDCSSPVAMLRFSRRLAAGRGVRVHACRSCSGSAFIPRWRRSRRGLRRRLRRRRRGRLRLGHRRWRRRRRRSRRGLRRQLWRRRRAVTWAQAFAQETEQAWADTVVRGTLDSRWPRNSRCIARGLSGLPPRVLHPMATSSTGRQSEGGDHHMCSRIATPLPHIVEPGGQALRKKMNTAVYLHGQRITTVSLAR